MNPEQQTLTVKGRRIWGGGKYLFIACMLWLTIFALIFILGGLAFLVRSGGLIELIGHLSAFAGRSFAYLFVLGPPSAYLLGWILPLGRKREILFDISLIQKYGRYNNVFQFKVASLIKATHVICFKFQEPVNSETLNVLNQMFPYDDEPDKSEQD